MRFYTGILFVTMLVGCGTLPLGIPITVGLPSGWLSDGKPPKTPADRLVGNWDGVSSTDPEMTDEFSQHTLHIRADGTLTVFTPDTPDGMAPRTWEIVGKKKLVVTATVEGHPKSSSYTYKIRKKRLTLVDIDSGFVEKWKHW